MLKNLFIKIAFFSALLFISSSLYVNNDDLKNTLIYAGESESTINPVLNSHDELPDIIFSGLMKHDVNNKPVPDMAESYTYDDKTDTYTFKLKKA